MSPLRNSRRERFCLAIMEGMTQADAYLKAGFKNSNSCRANAARLIATDSVRNRIGELKAEAAANSQVTVESLLKELEEVRRHASSDAQWGSVVKAIAEKVRISGVYQQTINVHHTHDDCPMDASVEDIGRWLAKNWDLGGVVLTKEQSEGFAVLLRDWHAALENFLRPIRAANAKPVIIPPAYELERRRLGLGSKPVNTGVNRSNAR